MPIEVEIDQVFSGEITEEVVYSRGNVQLDIAAIPDESLFQVQQQDGSFIEVRTQDFIVQQSDLDFGAGPTEPARKDRITRVINNVSRVYEVLSDPGLLHYRESDAAGYCYRVHTKEKPAS